MILNNTGYKLRSASVTANRNTICTPVELLYSPGKMTSFLKFSVLRPRSKISTEEMTKPTVDDMNIQWGELKNILHWLKYIYTWLIQKHRNGWVTFKDCVSYIFASLFYMCKWEVLWNKEKGFSFYFESSFRSWDNQILTFQIFKCYDDIKCLSMKHETDITE